MTMTKSHVAEMVKGLPAKVDWDDLIYRLYLLKKIEKGEADIRAKRTISHENLSNKMLKTRWVRKTADDLVRVRRPKWGKN